ncbi:hypothetical protein D9758_005941 [Tetrapyrgos nigripes]|uniref:FAD/NAD(P)-binding domain-containing protein n=1 Tax=Tetrapyrgos nigripes TaxID=182062 RepID=A0A8H5LH86_9AGAR|nr:hypothetical protein D9758_005941 [Tetrapyrgos nigripes]
MLTYQIRLPINTRHLFTDIHSTSKLTIVSTALRRLFLLSRGLSTSVSPMNSSKPNVVVVGGSYVGSRIVDLLAPRVYKTHNVIMIEKSSHFQNQFVFPRIHAVKGFEHKAFIPFTETFFRNADLLREELGLPQDGELPSASTSVKQGVVQSIHPKYVSLESGEQVPYEFLVIATGTGQPGTMKVSGKQDNIERWHEIQRNVEKAEKIVVVGAGAYGIQLVTDLKTYKPTASKDVTLVHSRQHVMNRFHPKLHEIVMERLNELGIDVVLGKRVVVPEAGFPNDQGKRFNVDLVRNPNVPLEDGKEDKDVQLEADLVVLCTSATPSSSPLRTLVPEAIHPDTGYIRVKPTMQIDTSRLPTAVNGHIPKADPSFLSHIFAIGDVADTGAHKAARPGYFQADVAARNIAKMIAHKGKLERVDDPGVEKKVREELESLTLHEKEPLYDSGLQEELKEELELEQYTFDPPGIHLSLGLDSGLIFRNPRQPAPENPNPEATWSWDADRGHTQDLEVNTKRLWDTRAWRVKDWTA